MADLTDAQREETFRAPAMPPDESELAESELKRELLIMDTQLCRKQLVWETPRNIAILVGATAAIIGSIAGFIGYKIGQTPSPPIIIHLEQSRGP